MKTLFTNLLLCIFIFSTSLFGQPQGVQKMMVEKPKNPGAAFLSSFVVPGAGQMYNGDVGLGLGLFLGEVAIFGFATNMNRIIEFEDWKKAKRIRTGCYAAGGVLYLVSIIQAPIKSKKLNQEKGFSFKKDKKLEFYANHQDGKWLPGLTLTF